MSPRRAGARAREHGFSFIEILIVMGIIAVLAGLVVVALQIWTRKRPEMDSSQRAQKLMNLAETWKLKFSFYPPVDLTRMMEVTGNPPKVSKVPNRINEGIESFYQAMFWPGFGTDARITEGDIGNFDDDHLDKEAARGRALSEVIDGYGYPLVYIPFTEYGRADEHPPQYQGKDGPFYPKPWKSEAGFENPNSCQVFSIGEDGEPNTEDDIKGW